MNYKKVTISLPPQLNADLGYLSHRMGISKSALLANISTEPISDMRKLLEDIPENPSAADIVRSRGASKSIVEKRLSEIMQLGEGDDLFAQ